MILRDVWDSMLGYSVDLGKASACAGGAQSTQPNGNTEERTVRVEGLACRLPSTLSAVFYRHALKW
jgi:hypothetical protein